MHWWDHGAGRAGRAGRGGEGREGREGQGGHASGPFKVSLWGEGAWSHGTIGPAHMEKRGIGPVG